MNDHHQKIIWCKENVKYVLESLSGTQKNLSIFGMCRLRLYAVKFQRLCDVVRPGRLDHVRTYGTVWVLLSLEMPGASELLL